MPVVGRTYASDADATKLLCTLLREYGWRRFAVMHSNVVVAVAERDSPEFRRQSAEYAQLLQRAARARQPSLRVQYLDVDDRCHFDIVETLCSAGVTPQAYVLLDVLRELVFPPGAQDSINRHRFHLISGMQTGTDRGAVFGIDRARRRQGSGSTSGAQPDRSATCTGQSKPSTAPIGGVSTGGWTPLGFKCDDFIQQSLIDSQASASVEEERKWIKGEINKDMCGWIQEYGLRELPNEQHKVAFSPKDQANADDADVLLAFRVNLPSTGAGTEQTINYGLFGHYCFVEQFKNGKLAGGVLQREGLISDTSVTWEAAVTKQVRQRGENARLQFKCGDEYGAWEPFEHTTPKDDEKSAKKKKDVYKTQAVTAVQLKERPYVMKAASRSVIAFTLETENMSDLQNSNVRASDDMVILALEGFIRAVETEHRFKVKEGGQSSSPLNIMVTGATEGICPGLQLRVQRIFEETFSRLLDK